MPKSGQVIKKLWFRDETIKPILKCKEWTITIQEIAALKAEELFFYLQLFLSPDKVKLASKWRLSMCQKKPSNKSKCQIIWHVLYNHSGPASWPCACKHYARRRDWVSAAAMAGCLVARVLLDRHCIDGLFSALQWHAELLEKSLMCSATTTHPIFLVIVRRRRAWLLQVYPITHGYQFNHILFVAKLYAVH